ncbi:MULTISPECIES: glycosyltransferase family 4 protein [unclassified Novosphingobium]|uniref:glycosyltransferase family 4 protein n=1 Tax=unclassified Novosphingobium TaxID=2644732 RepID=UPI000A7A663E|nr:MULTISPECIES: glycosyltransferase family 4 protein [unclassified Novosphingobium]MBN9142946.1 glycosyltransferase family 4 protein [Novosphingobium sp.]MDR6706031.1 glycosyltransferase involved in cell wall biosynthesis [Novosphingobium sp. 1748]
MPKPFPLLVATEVPGSGLGRFSVELANALEQAGLCVTFVTPPQQYGIAVSETVGLALPTGSRRSDKIAALCRSSLRIGQEVLKRAGKRQPFLLIHLTPTLPVSLAPLIAAKLKGARAILNLHDFYPHTMRFPARLHWLERYIYRWAYRRFDLVVTNNAEQTRRLIEEAGVPEKRIVTLFHGPFAVEHLRAPDGPERSLRLLVFGSIRPNKQVLESIRAVRKLREQGLDVELRIAGAPRREDAAYAQACLAEIPDDQHGFDVQARFIADEDLPIILSQVDAMLCPYVGFDSQSGVAVTAVSNGIPLIRTPNVGVPNVDMGDAPWPDVAPVADAEAIAQAIKAFAAIPRAGRQAQAAVLKERFLDVAGWGRLAQLYVSAMQRAGVQGDSSCQ